jgi:Protein of unknown function (DUF3071)
LASTEVQAPWLTRRVLPGMAPARTYRQRMRQLRLVHLSDDGTTLLLESAEGTGSAAAGEQYQLPVDAVLRRTVRTERPVEHRPAPTIDAVPTAEPGATISPREIQMRVRAGESPQALAETYNNPLDRILRFAAPVVDERARIAGEARRGRARRTTTDAQVVVFGEAVDARFAAHGIAPEDVSWDALRPDGEWVVVARWIGGEDEHRAEWVFHRASRTVTPVDDTAIDLLSDRPIRPLVPAEPPPPAVPPMGPGVFVFPPMPDAATGPVPRVEDVFDQEAPPEGPRDLPPLVPTHAAAVPPPPQTAPEPQATPAPEPNVEAVPDFDEPPLPLGAWTTTPEAEQTLAEKIRRSKPSRRREGAGSRTKVPSWDDILLGVRRESD